MNKVLKTLLPVVALLLIFGGTARAEHEGLYFGGYYGMPYLQDSSAKDDLGKFEFEFDAGNYYGGTLGYDLVPGNVLGEGRIEIEYGYRSNSIDRVKFVDSKVAGGGGVRVQSLMVNTFGVYRDGYYFHPYLGAGLGAAMVAVSGGVASVAPLVDDDTIVFAYQFGGGIEIPVGDYLRLDLGYRYFATLDPELKEANGSKLEIEYRSHTGMVGVVVLF